MRITLEPTSQFAEANGVRARVWQGTTESGVPLQALIMQVAVHKDHDQSQFLAELKEVDAPRPDVQVFPARFIL